MEFEKDSQSLFSTKVFAPVGIFISIISIIAVLICFWAAQELSKAFGIMAGIGFLALIFVIAIIAYFFWPILPLVLGVVYYVIRARTSLDLAAPTPPPQNDLSP